MREEEFREFLGKRYTAYAVNSRVSKGKDVETKLNEDLDTIVSDDDLMYRSLVELEKYDNPAHTPRQNALRKYYEFVNGHEFPHKKDYEKSHGLHI